MRVAFYWSRCLVRPLVAQDPQATTLFLAGSFASMMAALTDHKRLLSMHYRFWQRFGMCICDFLLCVRLIPPV